MLGAKAMAALQGLAAVLGLDYGGIDFGLNQAGEILLFEANATMVVEQPDGDPRWDYRRAAVERIHTAVRDLLLGRAGAIPVPTQVRLQEKTLHLREIERQTFDGASPGFPVSFIGVWRTSCGFP